MRGQRRVRALLALVVLVGAIAACGDDDSTSAPDGSDADPAAVDATLEEVATLPTALSATAVTPDGDGLFVVGLDGTLWLVPHEGGEGQPVLDITEQVIAENEQGMLGIAVPPEADRVFLSYTRRSDEAVVIEERSLEGTEVGADARTVLEIPQPTRMHNGGQVRIGPDGNLWFGVGDGGRWAREDFPEDTEEEFAARSAVPLGDNGQDLTTILGSVIRIDPDATGDAAYGIPDDNPFAGDDAPEGAQPEIFLSGLRNPWRFSFDPETDDLWVADVGEEQNDEIDLLPAEDGWSAGANLGWNLEEGDQPGVRAGTADPPEPAPGERVDPVVSLSHEDGYCAGIGGVVYRGDAFPELEGAYVFSDFCDNRLLAAVPTGEGDDRSYEVVPIPGITFEGATEVSADADGELLVTTTLGQLYRLVPAG